MTFVLVSVLYKHVCECIDDPFATPVTDATPTLPLFVLLVSLIGITNTWLIVIVSPSKMVTVASILASPMHQRALSLKIEDHQFSVLYEASGTSFIHVRPTCFILAVSHSGYQTGSPS